MGRKIKHIVEYIFARGIFFFYSLLPYRTAVRAGGRVLGPLTYWIGGSRRKLVRRNLEIAFPELSPELRAEMVRAQFRNVGYIAAEFVKMHTFDRAWMEKYVEWEPTGVAFVERTLAAGRGVMINGCHFGNWEILPLILPMKFNVIMNAIGANISNPYTHRFVWALRGGENIRFYKLDEMGAKIIKALKAGEMFAIASDQSAGLRGVFVPYFGRPTSTHTGGSQIAYLADAEVVFCVAIRQPEGRFRMVLVPIGRGSALADNRADAIRLLTLRYVDVLEKYVRKYPDQYFWLHNRWKTAPPADAKFWERVPTDLAAL